MSVLRNPARSARLMSTARVADSPAEKEATPMSTTDIYRERRQLVYQWWEEDNEHLPAEHSGLPITDEVCATYAERLWGDNPSRQLRNSLSAQRVRAWLEHPEKFSPHLDMVAVSRALDFDWPVLRNLTPDEYAEVTKRLAGMDDPYGFDEDDLYRLLRKQTGWGGSLLKMETPRHIRFTSGTPEEQRQMSERVEAARKRARRRAQQVAA